MSQLSVPNRDQESGPGGGLFLTASNLKRNLKRWVTTSRQKPPYHRVSGETLVKCFGTYYLAKDSKRIHFPRLARRATAQPPDMAGHGRRLERRLTMPKQAGVLVELVARRTRRR
eukprot:SAG22_NODE_445_length_10447_cov_4.063104_4_plen_115_part_00